MTLDNKPKEAWNEIKDCISCLCIWQQSSVYNTVHIKWPLPFCEVENKDIAVWLVYLVLLMRLMPKLKRNVSVEVCNVEGKKKSF